jgi:hypothetical protein
MCFLVRDNFKSDCFWHQLFSSWGLERLEKSEKMGYAVYSVPVIIVLKLKLVMLPAFDVADNVNVALVD